MAASPVVHDTVVIERTFPFPATVVFAAWADAGQRARWHFPGGSDWRLVEFKQDFRVGGRLHSVFGPTEHPNLREEGEFLDIVADSRIVSAGTMHMDDVRISLTLCTVELITESAGTRLLLTD